MNALYKVLPALGIVIAVLAAIVIGHFAAKFWRISVGKRMYSLFGASPGRGGPARRWIWLAAILAPIASMPYAAAAETQALPPFDAAHAKIYFEEAREVSAREAGRTWGKTLYGPIFFFDPDGERIIANEQDRAGRLHAVGSVFEGAMPKEITPSDAPVEWEGMRWTMLSWQVVSLDRLTRRKTLAHEMFHRIQPSLGLDAPDALNLQLDTAEGRLWLELEWRALAAALIEKGPAQTQAICDALAFRRHRQAAFPRAEKSEASLEIAEGVPEYTGFVAAMPDVSTARWEAAKQLADPENTSFHTTSFVRSFAYVSGPAYGLLLDERMAGWRKRVTKQADLGKLLGATVRPLGQDLDARAALYGAAALRVSEADRAAAAAATIARYRKLLIDGPTLTLAGAGHFAFTFKPGAVLSLGGDQAVYPTFKVSDDWGKLDVTDGALVPADFSKVTLAAPRRISGPHVEGPGWTLDLAPGWRMVPRQAHGNYAVQKH